VGPTKVLRDLFLRPNKHISMEIDDRPYLPDHFPAITAAELKSAHAYAYGGCVILDLVYYPFGNELFSDLTHYVPTEILSKACFGMPT